MRQLFAQADALRLPLADASVDLVLGSPPYCEARTYPENGREIGAARDCADWIGFMLDVTREALRVSRGPVVWVAASVTRERNYWPACEGLMYEAWRAGIEQYRPVAWVKTDDSGGGCGIPGSGGDDWFRADWEYCIAFKRPGKLPWSDNTAMGKPPAYGPGGAFSNRTVNGARVNDPWNKGDRGNGLSGRHRDGTKKLGTKLVTRRGRDGERQHTKRSADGSLQHQTYAPPKMSNPGNIVRARVGGGQLGHVLSHESDAPYPERVPEFFIRSLCPPGGIVLDTFSGSGTTVSVARQHGRHGIGFDLRMSQCKLGRRRVASQLAPHTYRDTSKADESPLFATSTPAA